MTNCYCRITNIKTFYLIVAIAGNLDARLPHLHVHNQTFHHRQSVLVITEVLKKDSLFQLKLISLNVWKYVKNYFFVLWFYLNTECSSFVFCPQNSFKFELNKHWKAFYRKQIHDCVTGFSKERFSEANAEQRTRINWKQRKRNSFYKQKKTTQTRNAQINISH